MNPLGPAVGALLALSVVGGFMAVDAAGLHWYAKDSSAIEGRLDEVEGDLIGMRRRTNELEQTVESLEGSADDGGQLVRLATMWSVEYWGQVRRNRGQFDAVSGTDPAVVACIAYILTGNGSFVECGFQRASGD